MASANILREIANPMAAHQQSVLNEQQIAQNQQNMFNAQEEKKRTDALRRLDQVGRVLYSATTPEAWANAINILEQQGIQVDDAERDFANRDAILGQLVSVSDQMKQNIDTRRLDIAQQNANTMQTRAAGTATAAKPLSPEGKLAADVKAGYITEEQANAKTAAKKRLSATELRFKRESENNVVDLTNTIENLKTARELAPKVFSGAGASLRAAAGANLPDWMVPDFVADPETAALTQDYEKIVSESAIRQMAETLKGATTDREMNEFRRILADPDISAVNKQKAIDRMLAKAQAQLELEEERVKEFEGDVESQRDQPEEPDDPQAIAEANRQQIIAELDEARARGVDEDTLMNRLTEAGLDPAEYGF